MAANLHHLALLVFGLLAVGSCASAKLTENTDNYNYKPRNGYELFYNKTDLPPTIPVLVPENTVKVSNEWLSWVRRSAAGYLLADRTDLKLNLSDPVDADLSRVLDKNGPDMRPSRDFKDFKDISPQVAKRAWQLLHDHASHAVKARVHSAWPAFLEVLRSAKVSQVCQDSVGKTLDGAMRMESWAVKMLNSWGNFPSIGLFEGTYSEVGSFHTCVNVPENDHIGHAHYCSITYRPVMPSRPDYELVVRKESDDFLNMTFPELTQVDPLTLFEDERLAPVSGRPTKLRDAFSDILDHAHYHHYVYYKFGTCWPIGCSPFDVRRVAKLLGRRNILLNGPVKCYSKYSDDYEEPGSVETTDMSINDTALAKKKLVISVWDLNDGIFIWKPYFNTTQKAALAVVLGLGILVAVMTLIDLFFARIPRFCRWLKLTLSEGSSRSTAVASCPPVIPIKNSYANFELMSCKVNNNIILNKTPNNTLETLPGIADEYHQIPLETCTRFMQESPPSSITTYHTTREMAQPASKQRANSRPTGFMSWVDDFSVITNCQSFFQVSEGQMKNDILCLNGIRCITMAWVILSHTMVYNDWSAFGRTRQIENSIKSLFGQPLFNGTYQVDTFFLMSGLLSAYTAFRHCQGLMAKFNSVAYIFGRWLRLTPQIFLVSMLYILVPALSMGPHWYPIVSEYSENCVENWWINVLHLQAFYKTEKMCNFVTWWISIDFFYHFFALAIILVILLANHRYGFASIVALLASQIAWEAREHYRMGLPPNILSTIPQTGAMWTQMTLGFFWTPATHAVPFFFGFYLGYLIAMKKEVVAKLLNPRRAAFGWFVSIALLVGQSFSTYWWVIGEASYTKLQATIFYVVCPIIWAGSICWIIIACHHGYGGFINRILSWKVFIVLGKASYLVYLSHFQVLFVYFGNQSFLLEPTPLCMAYFILGNLVLSTIYGTFLCIVFELPWLRIHRRLMRYV